MQRLLLIGLLTVTFVARGAEETPPPRKPQLALDVGGHTALVRNLFFTANDTRLVSVADDRTVRIWDVASGAPLEVIYLSAFHFGGSGTRADLAPDGNLLALSGRGSAETNNWIYLLDLNRRRIVNILKGSKTNLHVLVWSPDGKEIATNATNAIEVWDIATNKRTHYLEVPPADSKRSPVRSIAYNRAGNRLAAGTGDGSLLIWELPSKKLIAQPPRGKLVLSGLAWNKDGSLLAGAYGVGGRLLRLWSSAGKELAERKGKYMSHALMFHPENTSELLLGGQCLQRTRKDGWRIRTRFREAPDEEGEDEDEENSRSIVRAVAFAKNGRAVLSRGSDLLIWDTTNRGKKRDVVEEAEVVLQGNGRTIERVGWDKTGSILAWSHDKNAPRRAFDLAQQKFLVPQPNSIVEEQHRRGKLFLSRTRAQELTVLSGDKVLELIHVRGTNPTRSYSFLDDKRVVSGGHSGISLHSLAPGKLDRQFTESRATKAVSARLDGKYFASGGEGQTLHIYSPGRSSPLLSIYPAGKEWIAWTPEGYYAASPGGERLMGWLITEKADQLPTFHPAARFRKLFYRPDVIRELLKAGSVEKALAALSKGMEKPVELEKVLPPRVRILTPEPTTEVKSSTVQVKASAQGTTDHPVQSLQLVVDGRPYEPYKGTRGFRSVAKPTAGEKQEAWDVTLQPGKHEIRVVAKNALTTAVSDAVEITVAPEEKISASDDLRQALHVLAIGIDDYPGDLQLKCAVNDATKIAQTLGKHSKSLFPRGVFLHLRTNSQANKQGILKAFDDLAKQTRPQDVVVVFFAGHGHVEKADGKFYLLPHGVDIDAMEKTAVSETEFKAKLSAVPGQVVLMMDACHSGATKQKGLWARRATSVTDGVQRSFADEEVGVVVWLAAMGNEYAEEKEGHGLFTRAMMEGLAGAAGKNRKGEVHLASLDAYVFEKVTDWSEGKQRPNCARPPSVYPFSLSKPTKE